MGFFSRDLNAGKKISVFLRMVLFFPLTYHLHHPVSVPKLWAQGEQESLLASDLQWKGKEVKREDFSVIIVGSGIGGICLGKKLIDLGVRSVLRGQVRLTGSDVLLQVHYIGEAGQFRRNLVRKQVNTTCQHLIQETKQISPIHSIHTVFFSGWSKTHKYCPFSFSDIQDVPVIFQVTFTAFHSSRWDIIQTPSILDSIKKKKNAKISVLCQPDNVEFAWLLLTGWKYFKFDF